MTFFFWSRGSWECFFDNSVPIQTIYRIQVALLIQVSVFQLICRLFANAWPVVQVAPQSAQPRNVLRRFRQAEKCGTTFGIAGIPVDAHVFSLHGFELVWPAQLVHRCNRQTCSNLKEFRFRNLCIFAVGAFRIWIPSFQLSLSLLAAGRPWLSRWAAAEPPKWNSETQFWSCQLKSWWSVLPRICAVGLVRLWDSQDSRDWWDNHQMKTNQNATFPN